MASPVAMTLYVCVIVAYVLGYATIALAHFHGFRITSGNRHKAAFGLLAVFSLAWFVVGQPIFVTSCFYFSAYYLAQGRDSPIF
jgi:hypothetical protein